MDSTIIANRTIESLPLSLRTAIGAATTTKITIVAVNSSKRSLSSTTRSVSKAKAIGRTATVENSRIIYTASTSLTMTSRAVTTLRARSVLLISS